MSVTQELQALIKYIEINKATDLDWFTIKPSGKDGTHWTGKCWYIHNLIKYEFDFQVCLFLPHLSRCFFPPPCIFPSFSKFISTQTIRTLALNIQFDIPATYPATAPEIEIPELEGKTAKMYRGGKICLTIHFKPLWAKNSPHFGIAHALCLGLAPWMAAELPFLIESGVVQPKS